MLGETSPKLPGAGTTQFGSFPYGAVIDWFQPFAGAPVPPGFALCNGQTAVWQTGPLAGQSFTTPNLIGMYTMGADVLNGASTANASGYTKPTPQTVVGSTTTSVSGTTGASGTYGQASGTGSYYATNGHTHSFSGSGSNQPAAIAFAKIIRL